MAKLELYYGLKIHNKFGEVIKDTGLLPSHSYVIQFLELFEGFLGKKSKIATDVAGAENQLVLVTTTALNVGKLHAAGGDDTFGIVVGTNNGATPEANDNFNLDTKITTGVGGGQLTYNLMQFAVAAVVGPNVDFVMTRAFVNGSGALITVKEVGLIWKYLTTTKYHLCVRDVVSDEDVDDGETLTVTYTLRTTA